MSWADEEVKSAKLGDRRLEARFAKVLEQLGRRPQASIPVACGGWAETLAAYRFFENDKTTFADILAPHREATLERMAVSPVVLLVQDTAENDDCLCLGPKGLGTLKDTAQWERRLHPTVAFTPERICLGVVEAAHWSRDEPSPRSKRRQKGVDEKASRHWIESYQTSCALQGQLPNTLLVNVADREGDVYEWFAESVDYAPVTQAQWIVRAAQDRRLQSGTSVSQKLWDALERAPVLGAPVLGYLDVDVKPRPHRAGRQARVTVRAATVELAPPRRPGYRLPASRVNAVLGREEQPLPGVEALEWLLLTSLPVDDFAQASTVMTW
jgi:hypothetical protein